MNAATDAKTFEIASQPVPSCGDALCMACCAGTCGRVEQGEPTPPTAPAAEPPAVPAALQMELGLAITRMANEGKIDTCKWAYNRRYAIAQAILRHAAAGSVEEPLRLGRLLAQPFRGGSWLPVADLANRLGLAEMRRRLTTGGKVAA